MKFKLICDFIKRNAYGDLIRMYKTNHPEFRYVHICKNPFTKEIDNVTIWGVGCSDSIIYSWRDFLSAMQ